MSIPITIGAVGALAALAAAGSSGSAARHGSVEQAVERPRNLYDEYEPSFKDAAREVAEGLGPAEPEEAVAPDQSHMILAGFSRILGDHKRMRLSRQVLARSRAPEALAGTLLFDALIDYVRSGEQSFIVGPRLQEMFRQTKLPKVERWMLQPPYRCFYLALPGCELPLWGTQDGFAAVKGAFVDFDHQPGSMSVLIWAPTGGDKVIAEHYPHLRGKQLEEARRRLAHLGNDSYLTFNISAALADPAGIEAHILRRWDSFVQEEGWSGSARTVSAETRREVLKIVLGTMLYLQSDRQDLSPDRIMQALAEERAGLRERIRRVKNPTKRRKAEQRLASLPSGAVGTWLGRGIEEATDAEPFQPEGDRRTMRRHWVRGHWRRPARKHGPRVLRWIQPFQRGGGEDITSRTYELSSEKR